MCGKYYTGSGINANPPRLQRIKINTAGLGQKNYREE
jgi:hypothetical protein